MRLIKLSLLLFLPFIALGQDTGKSNPLPKESGIVNAYDKDLLTPAFHRARREALREKMPAGSVAIFFANPVMNRSNDVDFEFHQDPNFYYLTGLREPDAVLVVFKDEFELNDQMVDEIIYVRPRDPKAELWNGKRLGTEGVSEQLEFKVVLPGEEFKNLPVDLSWYKKVLVSNIREDIKDNEDSSGDLYSLKAQLSNKSARAGVKIESFPLSEIMAGLRQVKQPEELELMRKAIDITVLAQKELMRALEPGFTEYQSEAIVEYYFKKYGAEHWGFPSILGGGENSCVLHYTSNRKELFKNEMLVVDIGAEYHGYTADVTRTLPVDGKFSPEQKAIYKIVLEAQEAGIKASRAGNKFWDPHSAAQAVVQKRLLELGIIKRPFEAGKYFMHGTSHYLGLDVHDAGLYGQLEKGNVITVEPGIYIPEGSPCDPKWWNIGVRIEDDILITEGDPENLSIAAPRSVEEVEKLMQEQSLFNVIK